MAKNSKAPRMLPARLEHILKTLGRDLSVARRRRRIPQRLMAEKMMVNVETVHRLESGDPTVGIGIFATALFVLGLEGRLAELAAPSKDLDAQEMDIERLPRAIRTPSAPGLDI